MPTKQVPSRLADAVSGEEGLRPNPITGPFAVLAPFVPGARARLSIFDVRGRRVAVVEGPSGSRLVWEGTDRAGNRVGPGIYFYHLEIGRLREEGKVVMIR